MAIKMENAETTIQAYTQKHISGELINKYYQCQQTTSDKSTYQPAFYLIKDKYFWCGFVKNRISPQF